MPGLSAPKLYVGNVLGNDVTVIDTGTDEVTNKVFVGGSSNVLSASGRYVLVLHYSDAFSVIDAASDMVVFSAKSSGWATARENICLLGNKLYFVGPSHDASETLPLQIRVMDLATQTVLSQIPTHYRRLRFLCAHEHKILALQSESFEPSRANDAICIIDSRTDCISNTVPLEVPTHPEFILTPATNSVENATLLQHKLLLSYLTSPLLTVLDLDAEKIAHILNLGHPPADRIVVTRDKAYVALRAPKVAVLAPGHYPLIHQRTLMKDTIVLDDVPGDMALSGSMVYVGLPRRNSLAVIDSETDRVVKHIALDHPPKHVVPMPNHMLVIHPQNPVLSVIDARSHALVGTLPLGHVAGQCLVLGSKAYVIDQKGDIVSAIDVETQRIKRIPAGFMPCDMTVSYGERPALAPLTFKIQYDHGSRLLRLK